MLVKLNLCRETTTGCVTTHPEKVRAVVELVQDVGATPLVGDSPGGGSTTAWYKALLEKTGIQQVIDDAGCQLVRFDEARIQIAAETVKTLKKLAFVKAVTEADVIIGLPSSSTLLRKQK
ncbi:MAG TPA: DUF362 domain-containing protein [Candidatus Acidoferrales bacterium]|nr:DUF362 domain-containing protein [Candidatus Acidoferrales bacterium]